MDIKHSDPKLSVEEAWLTMTIYIYILYGCHLLLDVSIIYFISCDCIMNSSLSYPIY